MNFKSYLTELHNIEFGQAIKAHEPTEKASSSVANPEVLSQINIFLDVQFRDKTLSAESGIAKIRKAMHRYGFDVPALYAADPDGDEVYFSLHQFNANEDEEAYAYLYVLYYLTDEGYYDFFVRVVDESGLDDLLELDDED